MLKEDFQIVSLLAQNTLPKYAPYYPSNVLSYGVAMFNSLVESCDHSPLGPEREVIQFSEDAA